MDNATKFTDVVVRTKTKQSKLINSYEKQCIIGEGPYSKIKRVRNINSNALFAMKKYNLFVLGKKKKMQKNVNGQICYSSVADEVHNEVSVMSQPKNNNVIKLYQVIQDKKNQKLYLIMDYCEFGDIAKWNSKNQTFETYKKLNKEQVMNYFMQTANGLAYLHSLNIIHRDIKPQNILVDSNKVIKIIDFGRSVKLKHSEEKLKGSQGTYHFMPPEMLSQKYSDGYDAKKCDIWSLGVSFFAILFKKLPFYAEILIKLFQIIQLGSYKFPTESKAEYQCFKPIIAKMLHLNPTERPSCIQLQQMINKL